MGQTDKYNYQSIYHPATSPFNTSDVQTFSNWITYREYINILLKKHRVIYKPKSIRKLKIQVYCY